METIEDIDTEYENSLTKVSVLRDLSEFTVAGKTVGPFKSGQVMEVAYWVAEKLIEVGVAKFEDEQTLSLASLSKIHWKETIPASRQIAPLQGDFYSALRRFLLRLKIASRSDPNKLKEFEKAQGLAKDIANCRMRKIMALAAAPPQTDQVMQNLAYDERVLYNQLSRILSDWREKILGQGFQL